MKGQACTAGPTLPGHEYRLWLRSPVALYSATDAALVPGYRSPDPIKDER